MAEEEAAACVIDNGSGMMKAGFAGDDAPRDGSGLDPTRPHLDFASEAVGGDCGGFLSTHAAGGAEDQ